MLLISRDDASMKIGFSVDKAHLAYIREPVFLMFFQAMQNNLQKN